ncbi:RsmE family RNA methyltransferase [Aporhodopirellula aestuarii]|uniref:Ribosomal RNA small subunit methyltransferase E n=1 Tax=Aporhodopirellula aestuarii TaxID=2950107 RepID=A0ABT0U4C5_9BACT|nr:RsmE family RNA methyltransferase [Aporhodopirellula aestuarii]MCM2371779.1 16S rRNA (uracil(1498)-N(3))-methyltransferase [Aporhodopirellula aestuarii]
MTRRYFTPDLMTQQPLVELPPDEAAHAARVMRVRVDDTIEVFDGKGNQATATVTSVDKRQCICRCETPQFVDREPSDTLELAIAIPKPDRAKEMIERLTELGVTRIQPLVFERTQRPSTDSLIEKLERIVIEACKQSGRNHLMKISPVMKFGKWIAAQKSANSTQLESSGQSDGLPPRWTFRWVAMPGGQSVNEIVGESVKAGDPISVQCVIGPEGGLTDDELARCRDIGIAAIDLGKRILRVETAACVIAARFLRD